MKPDSFYLGVLKREIERGTLNVEDSILVVCGGNLDAATLQAAGFKNVTISNLDERMNPHSFAPYAWSYQDVEALTFADRSFDHAIVHSGLHHCYSPHRGLAEMMRVAQKSVIGFEPYESWITRAGAKLGYGQEYETSAVYNNECKYGGVRNTEIPNYVYRFSQNEIFKTAACFCPEGRVTMKTWRALRINRDRIKSLRNPLLKWSLIPLIDGLQLAARVIPFFNNNLGFIIIKPGVERLHPWIKHEGGKCRLKPGYLKTIYRKKNAIASDI